MLNALTQFAATCQTTDNKISAGCVGVPKTALNNTTLSNALTTTFIVVGSLCVLFVVIGGIRYVISGGDPSGISRAKDTIIYAVVGLVLTLSAFAIESIVLGIFH